MSNIMKDIISSSEFKKAQDRYEMNLKKTFGAS